MPPLRRSQTIMQITQKRQIPRGTASLAAERLEGRLLFAAHVAGSTTPYATIQAAVNAAPVGGVVTVDAGTYAEQVTISKTLTIRGAQAGVDGRLTTRTAGTSSTESIVTGGVSGSTRTSAFHILANDVTIDGFTVAGETNQDDQLGAGIVIGPKQSGTQIVNDVIRNNVSGLFLANYSSTDAALIQHDTFANNNNDGDNGGRGIYTDGTVSGGNLTNVNIDANNFTSNYGGNYTTGLEAAIALEAGNPGEQSAIRITSNTFTNNGKAVLSFNATNVLIQANTVINCQDQWSGSLRFEGHNDNISILYNTVINNTGPAVAIDSKGVPGDNYSFLVNYNNFYGNNYAYSVPISVVNNFSSYDGSFDARNNYWGSATGPSGYGTGGGDAVGGGVMQIGTGLGWALTPGGSVLYTPFSATPIVLPTAAPTAPTGLSAVAVSPTQMNLSWTDTAAGNETGFTIQRSSDGITFVTIGSTAAGITTYVDASGIAGGKTYTYRVFANNATGTSPASAVATGTTLASTGPTYLSDINWTSATTGYATVQKDATVNGNTITLRGTTYTKGIGAHAVSTIAYLLNGNYASFVADVGVDDEEHGNGSIDFKVLGDGVTLYDSGVLTGTSAVGHVNVSVVGVTTLTLVASNGVAGSIDYDHADWAGARLLTSTTTTVTPPVVVPAAPVSLVATAVSSSQINLSWLAGGATQTGFAIDRSIDGGVTFTPLATTAATMLSYSDTGLAAATKYVYRVRATNTAGTSIASSTATATTTAAITTPTITTTSLTKLTPTSATVGWGTLQTNASIKGNPLSLRGTTYATGLGAHASSTIVYSLAGKNTLFTVDVGVDDEVLGQGAVDFRVVGDGKVLFDSGVVTGTSAVVHISVSLVGVQTLTLLATPGIVGNIDYDHADWANPVLTGTA